MRRTILRKAKTKRNGQKHNKKKSKEVQGLPIACSDEIPLRVIAEAYPLTVQNMVGTAMVGDEVSLRNVQIATQGRYDCKVFPSSVSRCRHPRTTNSLFSSGRLVTTGATTFDDTLTSATEFILKVNRTYPCNLDVLNFEIQNIVSSFSLGFPLDVNAFYVDNKTTHVGIAHYKPDVFRGCSWRRRDGLVFVLFSSGRGVLTGATDWDFAKNVFESVKDYLLRYVEK